MEEAQLEAEKGEAAFNEWLRASDEKARAGVPLLPLRRRMLRYCVSSA